MKDRSLLNLDAEIKAKTRARHPKGGDRMQESLTGILKNWDFESLPLATALVYNLILPDYVKILCGSLNCLTEAFAQLDIEKHRNKLAGEQSVNAGSNDVVPVNCNSFIAY